MKILILGAAGQISRMLTTLLLNQSDCELVLYGRNVTARLGYDDNSRIKNINGDFRDTTHLKEALNGIDIVYLNDMGDKKGVRSIIEAMDDTSVKRIICATALGIYDEVPGMFGKWNHRMIGMQAPLYKKTASMIEDSDLDFTLLRLAWLYNQSGNERYTLTWKGQPFYGTQVTRQATSKLILDIIKDRSNKFVKQSIGVSEPNSDWDKPSFY